MKILATADDGWSILYHDAKTNKYFEKTYPNSEQHGGGQPKLDEISDLMKFLKRKPVKNINFEF